MWLEIARFDADFLYVDSLPAGLGSNDIGLDRGQLGRERVVRFIRSGPKVLLIESNLAFRAPEGSAAEQRAVRDSFAQSVVAGFEVEAAEGGRVLVDATGFFLRDAHDVIGTLKRAKQGTYTLDQARSAFDLDHTRNFPRNTEVEVTLTFAGTEPGDWVRDVAPDPAALTVRTHHSLVELPGPGYIPRAFDPRAGIFSPATRTTPRRSASRWCSSSSSGTARRRRTRGGAQRGGDADRLLPRSGHARADPQRAARGCPLVERRPSRRRVS